MKKGSDEINLMIAVILGVIAAGIFWSALAGKTPPSKEEGLSLNNYCNNEQDCSTNPDGSQCMVTYPDNLNPFCGCITSKDCINKKSGVCGSNNKCV
jgi:hypothetical protein